MPAKSFERPAAFLLHGGGVFLFPSLPAKSSASSHGNFMTDQLSGRLTASGSCNEGPIKVQLQIGNSLLRDALIRLLGKAKDLLVMDHGSEQGDGISRPSGVGRGLRCADRRYLRSRHFRNNASRPDELYREVKFILIGMNDDPDKFLSAIRAEVAGYLINDA